MARFHRLTIIVILAASLLVGSVANPARFGAPGTAAAAGSAGLHLAGYAALGVALRSRLPPGWRGAAAAVALATGFGAGVELVQFGLPYRAASVADAALNGAGATVGVAASTLLGRERTAAERTGG